MMGPVVSIIIPCFNGGAFVGEAIESALRQTYQQKELIVVDDGSTDDTIDILRSFGSRLRLITGPNCGAAASRNRGASAAVGDMLQFLDADDILYPDKLERQVELGLRHRDSLVFCDADVFRLDTGQPLGRWGRRGITTADPVLYVLASVLQTAAPIHWRETFFQFGGFRQEVSPCEDPDLHLRLACGGVPFRHLPVSLYACRRVTNSLSERSHLRGIELQADIAVEAYDGLRANGTITEARRAAFAGFLAATGRHALRYNLVELGRKCFDKAKEIHPQGGIPQAYSRVARVVLRALGPRLTERLASGVRRLRQDVSL